jgi:hypothetical protein
MKQLGIYGLFFLIVLNAYAKVIQVVSWRLNQEKIAASSCQNKLNPKMKCKGKCQLMQLNQESTETSGKQTTPPPAKKIIDLFPYILQSSEKSVAIYIVKSNQSNTCFTYLMQDSDKHKKLKVKPPEKIS